VSSIADAPRSETSQRVPIADASRSETSQRVSDRECVAFSAHCRGPDRECVAFSAHCRGPDREHVAFSARGCTSDRERVAFSTHCRGPDRKHVAVRTSRRARNAKARLFGPRFQEAGRQRERADFWPALERGRAAKPGKIFSTEGAAQPPTAAMSGAMSSETTPITLIRIETPGPEVSLKGSPTVSPTTAAL
jgi:hypothetical protein